MRLQLSDLMAGDLAYLADNLRPQDVAEVAAGGYSPLDALCKSVEVSDEVNVLRAPDGAPACIFGLRKVDTKTAIVWMLGTNAVDQSARSIIEMSHVVVGAWQDRFEVLLNASDSRNTRSHRWLKHIGFVIHRDKPITTPTGVVFFPISRTR